MNNKAFTLLELLVTIAIVAILATMANQVFQEYKVKAYNANALVVMRDTYTLVEGIRVDFDDAVTNKAAIAQISCNVGAKYTGGSKEFTNTNHTLTPSLEELLPGVTKENSDIWVGLTLSRSAIGTITWTISVGHCTGDILYWWHDSSGGGGITKSPYTDAPSVNFFKLLRCP